jgi:hypothetical protein
MAAFEDEYMWTGKIKAIDKVQFKREACLKLSLSNHIPKNVLDLLYDESATSRPLLAVDKPDIAGLYNVELVDPAENFLIVREGWREEESDEVANAPKEKLSFVRPENPREGNMVYPMDPQAHLASLQDVCYLAAPLVGLSRMKVHTLDAIDTVSQTFRAEVEVEVRFVGVVPSSDVKTDMLKIHTIFAAYGVNVDELHFLKLSEIQGDIVTTTDLVSSTSNPGYFDFIIEYKVHAVFNELMEVIPIFLSLHLISPLAISLVKAILSPNLFSLLSIVAAALSSPRNTDPILPRTSAAE